MPVEVPENIKDEKIRDLNEKLEKTSRDLKSLESSQKPLVDQINGMKELIEYLKGEHLASVDHINKSMKVIQDNNETIQAELQNLRLISNKKEIKITTLSSKIVAAENKEIKTEEKIKKILESRNLIEKELEDFKSKFQNTNTLLREKQIEIKNLQKTNNKLMSNIQALHEEYWKKDTNMIKIKKTILQQQKTIAELNANKIEVFKSGDEKLLKEIYERDQKIDLLKDMIKSIKLKQKDGVKKSSADPNFQDFHPEKFEKTDQELLNSLVSKCINKFFRIWSFHKNATDTPLDIGRMIKKLRQDLKLYSAFSTKDLQSSVPQLNQVLVDAKSHINLDELIGIISKVVYS